MYELMVEDTFAAAHALRGYQGACENLHGHTWKVQVFLRGDKLNQIGLLADFKIIKQALKQLLNTFDHHFLNEIPPFDQINATSENLARLIYEQLRKKTKQVSKITVWESTTACASYWQKGVPGL